MLDEFKRYCSLQRDQKPLAHLLIYMKRRGSWTQLNQIWKDLGPTGGGPFWNQTTLINKLDKLERLGIMAMERRVLPSSRSQVKRKTNTFYRLDPASAIFPHIYSMLKIYREESDKYSSELIDRPLDGLSAAASQSEHGDTAVERELEVAMELIGEVFSIGGSEVKKMVKERMIRRGMIKETKRDEKISQKVAKTKKQKTEVLEG